MLHVYLINIFLYNLHDFVYNKYACYFAVFFFDLNQKQVVHALQKCGIWPRSMV